MTRPLLHESMLELSARVDRNWGSIPELELVRSELAHRSTQAAINLNAKIAQRIADIHEQELHGSSLDENQIASETDLESIEVLNSKPASSPGLRRLFEDTRTRLVETGTRNRLVHVNRAKKRANVLNVVNEKSDTVFAFLTSEKKMRFLAIGKGKDAESDQITFADAGEEGFDEGRFDDNQLEVKLGPDALQKRLLKLSRDARTAEEEQGANILYLALGFMTWYEDKSSAVKREAPLVLLPVQLVRNERTSTYDIKARGDDIVTNLPLAQRLKTDFGMELPEIDVEKDWQPSDYFDLVEEMIGERERWSVDHDGMQLGFFSFAKLLMYLDLDPDRWPEGKLESHPLVNGLLHEGFEPEEPVFSPEDKLDEVLPPGQIFHVVDADSSQTKVIEEVRKGRNLVVQGPPGTGKSQTITNIIAAAAREGKTVLFVAEKMAALSVVHDRLVKTGLQDICLELHSKASNKKAVLAEIGRTLNSAAATPNMSDDPTDLRETRDRLNNFSEALHRPIGETGKSPFEALARQVYFKGKGIEPPQLRNDRLPQLNAEEELELRQSLTSIGELTPKLGTIQNHPFKGITNFDLQPVDLERFEKRLGQSIEALETLQEAHGNLTGLLEVQESCTLASAELFKDTIERLADVPSSKDGLLKLLLSAANRTRLLETLDEGAQWNELYHRARPSFIEAAFDAPCAHLRGPIAAGDGSFITRWGSAYRSASRELGGLLSDKLPKKAVDRLSLLDDLLEVQAKHSAWSQDEAYCASELEEHWRGARTDFVAIAGAANWAENVSAGEIELSPETAIRVARTHSRLQDALREPLYATKHAREAIEGVLRDIGLAEDQVGQGGLDDAQAVTLLARLSGMRDAITQYGNWAMFQRTLRRIEALGFSDIKEAILDGALRPDEALQEFDFARSESLWGRALSEDQALSDLRSTNRHELVAGFQELEKKQFEDNVKSIKARHLGQVPTGAQGEMRIIRGELGKQRAHMALRKLFSRAPTALRRIKPVLLMSPISVAQFLEPGLHEFDLLVIDEASQVRPEDALGAIARAKQIVVVGDQKQLPPTSFFDRLLGDGAELDDEEEDDSLLDGAASLGELESVLTLCEARGLSRRMLEWHYRSRDPSLITVSNGEFYKSELILPPSPLQNNPDFGLCFTRVKGAYDRGGRRDNRLEGEAIVERIRDHARTSPKTSLGVVTFSSAQRNLLTELLELARRRDKALDEFLREGKAEDFFVKNIENVQGDERDVILVSVGYGPIIPNGPLTSMQFGPVNLEGGERRLNVLFTRARLKCEVFASFDPSAIDTSKTSKVGPKVLKRFLEYAQTGVLSDAEVSGEDADSPFEEDVANVVRSLGFEADNQVGSAGFKIDLGIRDPNRPGTYILAIECDGATYHSALWARERDRLRQGVLEHLGWRFHRIWSTDWFYNRASEIDRLRAALVEAREASLEGLEIAGSNTNSGIVTEEAPPAIFEMPQIEARQMPRYQRAQLHVDHSREPHEVHLSALTNLVENIVEAEGPIHQHVVTRRVAQAFGKHRAGSRIAELTLRALRRARQTSDVLRNSDEYWFTLAQNEDPTVRDRSDETGAVLKAEHIPNIELSAAIALSREDNAGGDQQEIIRYAAQLLGFKRVGPDLRARFEEVLRTEA